MVSNINPNVPTTGNASTADVRGNFLIAANEITALQQTLSTGTLNAILQAIGLLSGVGLIKITGPGAATVLQSTATGEALATAASPTAARNTLQLGTAATAATTAFAAAGHTHSNPTDYVVMTGDAGSGGAQGAVPAPPKNSTNWSLFGNGAWQPFGGTLGRDLTATGYNVVGGNLKGYTETFTNVGNVGATAAIDFTAGTYQQITLANALSGGNCAVSFTNLPPSGKAATIVLTVKQDGTGSRTASFSGVKWAGGAAPTVTTTANAVSVLTFSVLGDGSTVYGFTGGLGMA